MSSSGLIYAVIVGAWAAYLVPMWLRRQDELNEARPTERFSTAIRLLSGRAAMERRYAAARARDAVDGAAQDSGATGASGAGEDGRPPVEVDVRDRAMPVTLASSGPADPARERRDPADRQGSPGRARVLARRRRTISLLFLAFTAGAIGAAVGGLDYLWAPAVPGILLTLYIAHLRRAEHRRFEFTMDQRRAAEAARRLRERPRAPRPSPARAAAEQTDHAEWVDQQRQPPEDGWEPAPVPMPTYVTAPVAPRGHGPAHGTPDPAADPWHPTRPAADPLEPRRTPLFDQYAPPPRHLPDPLDRPRAANE